MRHLLFISVLLLGTTWAMAQTNQTPTANTTNGEQTAAAPASSGGHTTVEGCLSSSGGNYMLTDKNGQVYQLTGDTAKLSDHVGHEMKITGTTSPAKAAGESSGSMGAKETIDVTSFKHISKTCKSGETMSH